jgi:alpha-L-fucosidase 2
MYPLHLINYDTDCHKRVYDVTLEHLEQLGTGWWVGFSFAMSAQLYAMAQNGNAAYEKLRTFAKGFVADNGFHLNGDFKNYGFSQWHYRPFTLESLFGYCDALQEMLLQDHQGYLDIFPAVPQEWLKKLSFKKLRSYGGVLVSAKAVNGQIEQVELVLPRDMGIKIKNAFHVSALCSIQDNKEKVVTEREGYFMIQGKNIFVLSGNTVYLVDSQGKVVKTGECGFGVVKIVPVSSSSCLAISHNSITKISMQ